MKKLFILLVFTSCFFSCIKKRAIKYDPELAGTWVANSDSTYFWLKVNSDGHGVYRAYERKKEEEQVSGQVRYSVFELKMWVGTRKFKVKEWLTADMKGVSELKAKDYTTLNDTTYSVDRRMVLRTSILDSRRYISFYRIKE
jgi:hypothetical protein